VREICTSGSAGGLAGVISGGYPTYISTCYRRLLDWEELGIWEHIWLRSLGAWEQQGKLDRSQAYLDGSFMPARKRGSTSTIAGRSNAALST
jgi:hypothetical protein